MDKLDVLLVMNNLALLCTIFSAVSCYTYLVILRLGDDGLPQIFVMEGIRCGCEKFQQILIGMEDEENILDRIRDVIAFTEDLDIIEQSFISQTYTLDNKKYQTFVPRGLTLSDHDQDWYPLEQVLLGQISGLCSPELLRLPEITDDWHRLLRDHGFPDSIKFSKDKFENGENTGKEKIE